MTSLGVCPVSAFAPSRMICIPIRYFLKALSKSDWAVFFWLILSSSILIQLLLGALDFSEIHVWLLAPYYELDWWTAEILEILWLRSSLVLQEVCPTCSLLYPGVFPNRLLLKAFAKRWG